MGQDRECKDSEALRLEKPRGNLLVIGLVYIFLQLIFLWFFAGGLLWGEHEIDATPFVDTIQSQLIALVVSIAALIYARQAEDHVYAARAALAGIVSAIALTCVSTLVMYFHNNTYSIVRLLFSVNTREFGRFAGMLGLLVVVVATFEYSKERLGDAARGGEDAPGFASLSVMIPILIILVAFRLFLERSVYQPLDQSFYLYQDNRQAAGFFTDLFFSAPPSVWNLIYTVLSVTTLSVSTPILAYVSLTPERPKRTTVRIIAFCFGITFGKTKSFKG
ncbi:MAG: hypothetical protein AAF742_03460 [Pseudomonadota bacterium]